MYFFTSHISHHPISLSSLNVISHHPIEPHAILHHTHQPIEPHVISHQPIEPHVIPHRLMYHTDLLYMCPTNPFASFSAVYDLYTDYDLLQIKKESNSCRVVFFDQVVFNRYMHLVSLIFINLNCLQ